VPAQVKWDHLRTENLTNPSGRYTAASDVLENGLPLSSVKEIQVVGKEKEYVVVKVGSGKYEFSTAYKAK